MNDFYGDETRANYFDDVYEQDYDFDMSEGADTYPDYADFDEDDADTDDYDYYQPEDQFLDGMYEE